MRVLGIDPGLAVVGLGWVDAHGPHRVSCIDFCTIQTTAGSPLADRLHEIARDFRDLLDEIQPDLAVIERLFFAVNAMSAIEVAQSRGVLLSILAERGIPILEPSPLQMKSAITGDGKADKRQVQDMLVRLLKLPERPQPVDAADALALAYYGALQPEALTAPAPTPRRAARAA